jgi:23S rRNA (cytidine1920-2'-O)/16S rRNA (cytidine1409-2'-O)-methyltransferase
LDQFLQRRGIFPTRERARRAIMAGIVEVDGTRVDKPGRSVAEDAEVLIAGPAEPFVSRGGRKLEAALDYFEVDPTDWVCLDVGASTGGFTDCLLQRGARKVYAVDVGYGQLDFGLRNDPRVEVMERVNARHLKHDALGEQCDLATFDLSFISLVKVVPAIANHVRVGGFLLMLVKPQFEAGRGEVGRGGIVRDEKVRHAAIARTVADLETLGLAKLGLFDSPVHGAKGNKEAFALFIRGSVD